MTQQPSAHSGCDITMWARAVCLTCENTGEDDPDWFYRFSSRAAAQAFALVHQTEHHASAATELTIWEEDPTTAIPVTYHAYCETCPNTDNTAGKEIARAMTYDVLLETCGHHRDAFHHHESFIVGMAITIDVPDTPT